MTGRDPLADAVRALVDGRPSDWPALAARAESDEDRATIETLREIDAVSRLTRLMAGSGTIGIPSPQVDPGERWGPLQILELIGRGAHGTVFRAWDTRLAREVALKLVRLPDSSSGAETLREARLLAKVQHPGVVTVYGADRYDGMVGWWMPLLHGVTLEEILQQQGPWSAGEAALIGRELCHAVSAVHAAGLVHGDIKLQNIMRERGGRIVLMDFGAGTSAETAGESDSLTGTPLYLAPEVLSGGSPTKQSDIYALGASLFRLVTGAFPIGAESIEKLKAAHASADRIPIGSIRPDIPERFTKAIDRALALAPADRFESAAALGAALQEDDQPTIAQRLSRRRTLVAALLAAAAVTALVWASMRKPPEGHGPRSDQELSASTVKVWNGFEEIAWQRANHGDFAGAANAYLEALQIVRTELPDESGVAAACYGKAGWMLHLAHREADARTNLQLAAVGLQASAGDTHPLRATVLAAMTATWQSDGNITEAMKTWREAVAIRQRFLGLSNVDADSALRSTGIAEARWADALRQESVAADDDGDGLSNAVEMALALNPRSQQSRPGEPDGDGDVDGDGWPDSLELGLDWDPSAVISHYGNVNPASFGFQKVRAFEHSAVVMPGTGRTGWRIKSESLGHYTFALPTALKERAVTGFTLTARSRLAEGGGYVGLDLFPVGPRFDMDSYFTAQRAVFIKNNTGIVPQEGPEYLVGANDAPLVQLRYSPDSGGTLWIDGHKRGTGYGGFSTYQENQGVFFGAYNLRRAGTYGVADYALVHLVVHGSHAKSSLK